MTDHWSPDQYNKFREQRRLPFGDLVALVRPVPDMRIVDLGCGTGELTSLLADEFPDATVEGIDSSPSMLERAAPRATGRLRFRREDVAGFEAWEGYDLIFSHAALQWVAGHERWMPGMLARMKPGAQLALQMPKNERHPSHRIADELARQEPFRTALGGFVRESAALEIERYASLLHEHGFREHVCFEKVYGHELASSADVVEWVKGTMLNAYLSRLPAVERSTFLGAYRARLLGEIGTSAPYFYPFRRLLVWGLKSDAV